MRKLGWMILAAGAAALAGCGDDTGGAGGAGGSGAGGDDSTTTTGTTTGEGGGGGGAITCDVCGDYGAAVPAVVDGIIEESLADDRFADDFAVVVDGGDARVAEFRQNLIDFITDAYGCTEGAYGGPDMVSAHEGLTITSEDYDAFVGLIAGVLVDAGVPEDYVGQCFAPAIVDPALKDQIVTE